MDFLWIIHLFIVLEFSGLVTAIYKRTSFKQEIPRHDQHFVSDFVLTQRDTPEMRYRRDAILKQPFDSHLSISFIANGSKHSYDLELDCSAYFDEFTFDFYEYSEESNSTNLKSSISPTCNHYKETTHDDPYHWISVNLLSENHFRAKIAFESEILIIRPFESTMTLERLPYTDLPTSHKRLLQRRNVEHWDNCFNDGGTDKMITVALLVDRAYTVLFSSELEVIQSLSDMIESTNRLYQAQFGLSVSIGSTTIMMNAGGPLWNKVNKNGRRSCWPNNELEDIDNALIAMVKWQRTNPNEPGLLLNPGVVHLISDCFGVLEDSCSVTNGIAFFESLCNSPFNVGLTNVYTTCNGTLQSDSTWLTFAHEMGHHIGADHTFDVGGIMDYGNITYNGVVQFHPDNRDQICEFLKNKENDENCLLDARINLHKSPYRWHPIKGDCNTCVKASENITTFVCYTDMHQISVHDQNCDLDLQPHNIKTPCTFDCTEDFLWILGTEGPCVGPCRRGNKMIAYSCFDVALQKVVPDSSCDEMTKPAPEVKPCITGSQCFHWVQGDWTTCSRICGKGTRKKYVTCQNNDKETVDNYYCLHELGRRIDVDIQVCNEWKCKEVATFTEQCQAHNFSFADIYSILDYEEDCKLFCGNEDEVSEGELVGHLLPYTSCDNGRGLCFNNSCSYVNGPIWQSSEWSVCPSCNNSTELLASTREVTCVLLGTGEELSDEECVNEGKERPIDEDLCCSGSVQSNFGDAIYPTAFSMVVGYLFLLLL